MSLAGKRVLITGAAGSIGSEVCRQVAAMDPDELALLDIDESRLFDLWADLDSAAAKVRISDIRDAREVERLFAFSRPDIVIHCAAYKHVPLMEAAPVDAVKTNVIGTANVVNACEAVGVSTFVLVSTDKAVEPICVMGYTKAIAERVALNAADRMDVRVVRFGNVAGSRGSVIPTWAMQGAKGRPITVTHPEVTRYFMTIPEAAGLIIAAVDIGDSGDILVLDMGAAQSIDDMAHKVAAEFGVEVIYTGLRQGEKIHETLTSARESLVDIAPGIRKVVTV